MDGWDRREFDLLKKEVRRLTELTRRQNNLLFTLAHIVQCRLTHSQMDELERRAVAENVACLREMPKERVRGLHPRGV